MKSTLFAITLTALSVICGPTAPAAAQDAKVARGTIAAMGGKSVTVKVGDQDMTFSIDSKTMVQARGASTKSSRAAAAGKPGPRLDDVLQTGQAVAVTYNDMAGTLHATEIKAIPKAGASTASAKAATKSAGVVKSMGADWITINGRSGGGSSFEQTFKIDPSTKVFGKGAGTAVAAKGGKAPFTDLVVSGDHVSVSYHKLGNSLVASDVHVTMKASSH
jgi:Domain of unknown function (DUF5666)